MTMVVISQQTSNGSEGTTLLQLSLQYFNFLGNSIKEQVSIF